MILVFEMSEVEGGDRRPNTHWLDFSEVYTSLVAIPRGFDCVYRVRDEGWLGGVLEREREERSAGEGV